MLEQISSLGFSLKQRGRKLEGSIAFKIERQAWHTSLIFAACLIHLAGNNITLFYITIQYCIVQYNTLQYYITLVTILQKQEYCQLKKIMFQNNEYKIPALSFTQPIAQSYPGPAQIMPWTSRGPGSNREVSFFKKIPYLLGLCLISNEFTQICAGSHWHKSSRSKQGKLSSGQGTGYRCSCSLLCLPPACFDMPPTGPDPGPGPHQSTCSIYLSALAAALEVVAMYPGLSQQPGPCIDRVWVSSVQGTNRIGSSTCNPIHSYLEVSPVELKGIYFQGNLHKLSGCNPRYACLE